MDGMNSKYYILAITTTSTMMAAIDSTIVYLALPSMGRTFNSGISFLTLIILAYIIASTAMLIPGIEIIKKFGNKKFYIIGFGLFIISSLGVALSPNVLYAIIYRFVEGIGAGIMTSTDIPIILDAFPPGEKGKAIGFNSISWSVGTLMGPLLGGFLVTYDWRYIFIVNIPIGIIAISLALKFIKKDNEKNGKINYLSPISMVIFIVPLLIGISFISLKYLILAVALLPLFIYIQRKYPLISRTLLRNRQFVYISLTSLLESFAFFAVIYSLSLYFESYLRYSPLESGILIFTYPLGSIISSPIGGILYDKYGHGDLIIIFGILIEAINILITGIFLSFIPLFLFIAGFGGSLFWSPSTTMITDVLGSRYRTQANNSLFILRNFGMMISISMLPVFILLFSHVSLSIGNIFLINGSIKIYNSTRYYLIFSAIIALTGIIPTTFNFKSHRSHSENKVDKIQL